MIHGIHHTAISSPDLERALRFYRDLLGATVATDFEWPAGLDVADRDLGSVRTTYGRDPDGNVIELQEVTDPSSPVALAISTP